MINTSTANTHYFPIFNKHTYTHINTRTHTHTHACIHGDTVHYTADAQVMIFLFFFPLTHAFTLNFIMNTMKFLSPSNLLPTRTPCAMRVLHVGLDRCREFLNFKNSERSLDSRWDRKQSNNGDEHEVLFVQYVCEQQLHSAWGLVNVRV